MNAEATAQPLPATAIDFDARRGTMSNMTLAMIAALATIAMFFAGIISAYFVSRASAPMWPPADQPRLPVGVTAINTVILIASGAALLIGVRVLRAARERAIATKWVMLAAILGATFVAVQGYEWVKLIGYGLTTTSSVYGAFFYFTVGAHALHVLFGLGLLTVMLLRLRQLADGKAWPDTILLGCSMYWIFVVVIWPLLYVALFLI